MKIPTFYSLAKGLLCLSLFIGSVICSAQPSFHGLENLFNSPESYVIGYTPVKPVIDGNITDAAW